MKELDEVLKGKANVRPKCVVAVGDSAVASKRKNDTEDGQDQPKKLTKKKSGPTHFQCLMATLKENRQQQESSGKARHEDKMRKLSELTDVLRQLVPKRD